MRIWIPKSNIKIKVSHPIKTKSYNWYKVANTLSKENDVKKLKQQYETEEYTAQTVSEMLTNKELNKMNKGRKIKNKNNKILKEISWSKFLNTLWFDK